MPSLTTMQGYVPSLGFSAHGCYHRFGFYDCGRTSIVGPCVNLLFDYARFGIGCCWSQVLYCFVLYVWATR